jgi:fatty acid desaturase
MMDYLSLKKEIVEAGLMERQYAYYAFKIIFTVGLLALSSFLLVTIDSFVFQLLNTALLAFVFVQFGLLMHDANHM